MARLSERRDIVLRAWLIAAMLVFLSGISYRLLARRFGQERASESVPLPNLISLPVQIEHWQRVDDGQEQVSDSSVTCTYRHKLNNASVKVFLVCTSLPRDILDRNPRLCYEGDGWIHERTRYVEVTSQFGRTIPCNIHEFYRSSGEYRRLVVLTFYIVNGQVLSSEEAFSGAGRRRSAMFGPSWYAAQVQISSDCESSVILGAECLADVVLDMLPDEKVLLESAAAGEDVPNGL